MGGDGLKLSPSKPQKDGTILMAEVDPSRHHVKILIWLGWSRLDGMVKKCGREMFILHVIIPTLYPFW